MKLWALKLSRFLPAKSSKKHDVYSSLVVGILAAGFIVAAVILNLFLKVSIISPITKMSKWSRDVSTGDLDADFEHKPNDEIGVLAASVNRLKVSLEMAMNMLKQNPDHS